MPSAQAAEEAENAGANDSSNPTMGEIIAARFSRRDLLGGALAVTAISATVSPLALASAEREQAAVNTTPSFIFKEVTARADDRHDIADGYDADILIRWGDAVLPGAPEFDPTRQTAAAQARQFGYNNDYLGYVPLDGSRRGLLVVNHEYTNEELMFPGVGRQDVRAPPRHHPARQPASYDKPSTRWPDFRPDLPPRPANVVVTRRGGGKIAG